MIPKHRAMEKLSKDSEIDIDSKQKRKSKKIINSNWF